MQENTMKKYEKPMLKIEKSEVNSNEAYSAAAVPVAAPAITPVIYGGASIAAAVLMKNC